MLDIPSTGNDDLSIRYTIIHFSKIATAWPMIKNWFLQVSRDFQFVCAPTACICTRKKDLWVMCERQTTTQITHQPLQMLHKHLQTNIICENGLTRQSRSRSGSIHRSGHVCSWRVKLGQKESGLWAALVADYIPWHGGAVDEEVLKRWGGRRC